MHWPQHTICTLSASLQSDCCCSSVMEKPGCQTQEETWALRHSCVPPQSASETTLVGVGRKTVWGEGIRYSSVAGSLRNRQAAGSGPDGGEDHSHNHAPKAVREDIAGQGTGSPVALDHSGPWKQDVCASWYLYCLFFFFFNVLNLDSIFQAAASDQLSQVTRGTTAAGSHVWRH